jgi:hypothetical protein
VPDRLLFHFTHLDNLPAILATGALLADADVTGTALVTDMGNAGIERNRRRRPVPLPPGGVVADYVPFYFAPRSPMLYRICCDHRDGVPGRYPDGEDPLVYLVTSVDRVVATGRPWLATDGNAAVAVSRFTAAMADLPGLVDWPLMAARFWAPDTDDPDRERRRMAELLVHRHLPLSALAGFAARTEHRARQVRDLLTTAGRPGDYVSVRRDWYYGIGRTGVNG